jgi:protein-tyrosine phosphatase
MRLLVVCLGNICRSPMAEGALRARLDASPLAGRVQVDSAGTGDWHVGEPPDRRAIACAAGHGVDIGGLRARQLQAVDFDRFDWILCADEANLRDAGRLASAAQRERLALYLPWSGGQGRAAIPTLHRRQRSFRTGLVAGRRCCKTCGGTTVA